MLRKSNKKTSQFADRFFDDFGSQNQPKMDTQKRAHEIRGSWFSRSKNGLQKYHRFSWFWGGPWAPCGHILGNPGIILATSGLPELKKLNPIITKRDENQQEPPAKTLRIYRNPRRTYREPAEIMPRTSKNPPNAIQ